MTPTVDPSTRSRNTVTYIVLGAVFLILAIIAVSVFRSAKATNSANQKADELITKIEAAGYAAPPKNQIVRTLGSDGGSICADPNNALRRAIVNGMITNGAAGPGQRPVLTQNVVVKGEALVISIYCPDQLPAFQQYVDSLRSSDTVS